ncbi:hypothetical protein [Runella salmonicolor]|uniref:Uncharacterized protein n=1 Tax=Runella salmonicolor TaxID=2950278 RepID=A0ABT1FS84_9BACT|nr:hypothetical protein [Runella salmonicolor]MCP1384599.1 hypothetical protein [Runella salmonicolor]
MNPKLQLEEYTLERIRELKAYCQRPDAKESYISRQNEQLSVLTAICNNLEALTYYDVWVLVESEWRKLERQDANFSGIAIELSIKPNGILCRLPISLYAHGV